MAAAADGAFTPEQWQLFWSLKEAFPRVSGDAIKQHLDKDHQAIVEMIFDNELPAGDEYVGDSYIPPEEFPDPEPEPVRRAPGPVRAVGLIGTPGPRPEEAPQAPTTPRTPAPATPRAQDEMTPRERSKKCAMCDKTKERVTYCHCIDVDPLLEEEPDEAEHCVCADCLKLRYMRRVLEVAEKDNQKSLFCIVKKCSRVIGRDLLLAAVDKPAMVEWMLGSNVSLREASVRQVDRETKRQLKEEAPLTPADLEHYERILDLVEADDFVKASAQLPDVCFSWLLDKFDFGEQYLLANQAIAARRKTKRRDRAGITHLVERRLKLQTTFTCIVCYEDYRTHLAVSCVEAPGQADGEEYETHSFCAECARGHAKVALEQNVIVRSGIGIKCMQPGCGNILLRAHIEQVLDAATLAALDPYFANEAILAAGVQAEKCQRCAFAAILVESPEQHPVFECRRDSCRHKYCRMCGRVWDERHEGKKCDDLDPEAVRRKMEEKLTEQLMHKCPRCAKPFVKIDGCNKISCPCGQLSCFVCKQPVTGYDHFQDRTDSGKCSLWEDPTKREREDAMNMLNGEINGAVDEVAEALRQLK